MLEVNNVTEIKELRLTSQPQWVLDYYNNTFELEVELGWVKLQDLSDNILERFEVAGDYTYIDDKGNRLWGEQVTQEQFMHLASVEEEAKPEDPANRKPWKDLDSETRDGYTEGYYIWLDLCKDYEEDVAEGRSTNSKPEPSDWKLRVIDARLNIGTSPRTLSTIKAYAKAGDIPKRKRKK